MQIFKWSVVTFRVFGVANLVAAGLCVCFTIMGIIGLAASNLRNSAQSPYFLEAFVAMVAINITFEIMLAIAGVRLWQTRREGLAICNVLFPVEAVYFLIIVILWSQAVPESVSLSVAGATGIGNGALVLQWSTGYPIIALVVLNILRRRLNPSPVTITPLVPQS
jgi:hypothetical protein